MNLGNQQEQPRREAPQFPSYSFVNRDDSGAGDSSLQAVKQKRPTVVVVEGDLLKQNVDAIVNAWNRNLIHYRLLITQGVSGAIKRAAGTAIFKELRNFGVIPLGGARLTSAGSLPFKGIIHVAGINHAWRSSEYSVRRSVQSALTIAANQRFESVAFPAIGSGSSLWGLPIWGVSTERSLKLIEDEALKSNYPGKVVIVKFKR